MSGKGAAGAGSDAEAAPAPMATDSGPNSAAAPSIKREEEPQRSKRSGGKRKPANGARGTLGIGQQPEPLALNPTQGEFVRVVKVRILLCDTLYLRLHAQPRSACGAAACNLPCPFVETIRESGCTNSSISVHVRNR